MRPTTDSENALFIIGDPEKRLAASARFDAEMAKLRLPGGAPFSPPPCFDFLGTTIEFYEHRKSLICSFAVRQEWCNPAGGMQGGLITAAFDNVMGPLSYLAARKPCTTVDLNTQYLRPILPGDTLCITARVEILSPQIVYMTGEAVNSRGKRIATANTNLVVLAAR